MSLFHHRPEVPEGFVKSEDLAVPRNQDTIAAADKVIEASLSRHPVNVHPWAAPDNDQIARGLATIARSQRILVNELLRGEEEANQYLHGKEGIVHKLVYDMGAILLRASTQHLANAQTTLDNPDAEIEQPIRDEFVAEGQLPDWLTAAELPRSVLPSIDSAYVQLQGWSADLQKNILNSEDLRSEDAWYADMLRTQFSNADAQRRAGSPYAAAVSEVNPELLEGAYSDLHLAYAGLMQATIYTLAPRVAAPSIAAA